MASTKGEKMHILKLIGRFALPALLSLSVEAAQTVQLNWVGCGITKKAFMSELSAAYEKATGVQIQISGGGATKGIRQVAANQVDMGGSCRNKLWDNGDEEMAKLDPVAWDALVVIVHPDNPVNDISIWQLREILLGKVTNWSALGGPDEPIELMIRRGRNSGVGHTIRELLFANPDMEFASDRRFPSSGPLEKALESSPYGIAVTGISSARKRDLKILNLEGKAPNYENIKSGAYLLYRPLYLVSNRGGEQIGEVRRFIRFAHSQQGRSIIRRNGVVPYLDALHLVREQRKQWDKMRELRDKKG
jgi:phosphate transport system substrate-binding protein